MRRDFSLTHKKDPRDNWCKYGSKREILTVGSPVSGSLDANLTSNLISTEEPYNPVLASTRIHICRMIKDIPIMRVHRRLLL